ncbi:putative LIM domain-containing serine/threonine-protein kinase, partial [Tetrabaena socialis]
VRLMDETGADGQLGFTATVLHGTVPYMSPELFEQGRVQGPALDVYAVGITMWELMHGRSAFGGVNKKELPLLVVRQRLRPVFHPLAPPDYSALACRCWSAEPEHRPTASELVSKLQQLLSVAKAAATAQRQQRKLLASGPVQGTRAQ